MERKKISQGDKSDPSRNEAGTGKRNDSPTRQDMERKQRLENASEVLRSEYEQYKKKAEKHGKTLFNFDKKYGELTEILNMPSDDLLKKPIFDYKFNEDDSPGPAGYETWNENTINEKFAELRQKLNFVEKNNYLEPYIEDGKTLKRLDSELEKSDLEERIKTHNEAIKDHNTYSYNKVDIINIEHWMDISDRIFDEKVKEENEE